MMSDVSDFSLDCGPCVLRAWRQDDQSSLLRHADNPNVAANMRDRFPHPYTKADAAAWLERATGEPAGTNWAIDVDGEAVGGIGLVPQQDFNRGTAEIGYWLGEAFWGRGIVTAAVIALTRHALRTLGYRRLFATALIRNTASQRVLKKAGYVREGVFRCSAIKEGVVLDQVIYSFVESDLKD